jgi:hypothetical protein
MGRECKKHAESSTYRGMVGKPEGKKPPIRPRSRRNDNIEIDLRERGLGAM